MSKNYKELILEQRIRIRDEGAFGVATEDVTTLLPEDRRGIWGSAPKILRPTHPRLMFTEAEIPGIRKALEDDIPTNRLFKEYLTEDFDGILPPAPDYDSEINEKDPYLAFLAGRKISAHNFEAKPIEQCAVKALGYKLYDNEDYGYQAIYALKNYLYSMDFKSLPGDQYRAFGYVLFLTACVYDWCYELLDDEDKQQLIAAAENKLCKGENMRGVRFEMGFPPCHQSGVCGHGSEFPLLRDHLSFAIAIYDENPSWWDYTGARFFNDFLPFRNHYYKSGIAAQGTGYAPLRCVADFFSAWIIKYAVGYNPYVGIDRVARSFFGYEYGGGHIFNDGDSPSLQDLSKFRDLAFIAAYLTGDAGLLAQGEHILGDGVIKEISQGLHLTSYIIMRGTGLKPAKSRFDGMELIQYNGSPLCQYVVKDKMGDANAAAVFTRIRERSTANHEHRDAGSFCIYYKGLLTGDSGVYDYYGNDHWKNYLNATVAHNSLLVYNPAYRKENKWYSGGQRYIYAQATLTKWLEQSNADMATLTAHESAYRDAKRTKPHYTYLAGDIAKAYEPDTVSYLGRRMLTVYTENPDFPMALFVYDDVESQDPSFKKTFLMHVSSPDAPRISGGRVITENGDGRLVLNSLSKDVKIKGVGGRGYDEEGNYLSDKSRNYLINGKQCHSVNKKDDGHWGRVEISPISESSVTEFLNLLYVTDRGTKKIAPKVTRIDAKSVVGAVFGKTVALFATSRTPEACEISAEISAGKGNLEYFVSGLRGGEWQVTVDGKDYGCASATAEGGLLVFKAPAGAVVISPVK